MNPGTSILQPRMGHGLNTDFLLAGGHSSSVAALLRRVEASPQTRLPASSPTDGENSALTPALSPRRGRNVCRGRKVRCRGRAGCAALGRCRRWRVAVIPGSVGDVLGDVAANFGGGFLGMAFDLDHVRHAAAKAAFEGPVRVHVFGVFHGELRIRKSGIRN